MSSRRTLILLGSIALGVVAAFALFTYVSGIEEREAEKYELVKVFKANEYILRGTDGTQVAEIPMIVLDDINRQFVPQDAIDTSDAVVGKVALFDIPPGTPIVTGMFVDPTTQQLSFRDRLKNEDWVTVTIAVGGPAAVADLLVPGDEVNIFAWIALPGVDISDRTTPGIQFDGYYEVLYQKVHILAIGQSVQLAPGEEPAADAAAAVGGLVTFNVPPDAALLIASVDEATSLYLSLHHADYEPVPILPLPATIDLLPGENGSILTPYEGGPDGSGRGGE